MENALGRRSLRMGREVSALSADVLLRELNVCASGAASGSAGAFFAARAVLVGRRAWILAKHVRHALQVVA